MEMMLQEPRASARRLPVLTAADPAAVFAAKSLLYPVGAVASLMLAVWIWDERVLGLNFLVGAFAFLLTANFCGLANIAPRPKDPYRVASLIRLLQRWWLLMAFMGALLYLSRPSGYLNLQMYLAWAAFTPGILWLAELVTARLLASSSADGNGRRAVIVGVTDMGLKLQQQLTTDTFSGLQVVGFFEDRSAERLPRGNQSVLGKCADLADFVGRNAIHVVYVTLPMARNARSLALLEGLRDSAVSIYFVPDLLTLDLVQARFDVVGGMPVVALRESPFYGAHAIVKRASDIALGLALLVILAPLMFAVGLGVRLTSPGPAIFRQRRYGLDGQEIVIYKFRSMTVMEDGNSQYRQVTRGDARVTPFGAFIRRTSLDELPQLFNVLAGTLSIVGPRPHAIAVNEQYRKLIPSYMVRHKVKPGITGWAQINGCRGGDDLESMTRRISFDLDYLRNWSLALDISIVLKTASMMWNDRRAY
jgi:putative colanic acid biosynthesis UDP-glucose lipid carrier transferase